MGRVLTAVLILLAVAAHADDVKVTFPKAGDYEVWFENADGAQLGKRTEVKGLASTTVVIPDDEPATLLVSDKKRAVVAVKEFEGGAVTFAEADFKYAREVRVTVRHDGKPVASAMVRLKDKDGERRELLSPEMGGAVTFKQVRTGEIVAWVEYRTDGTDRESPQLHMSLQPEPDGETPVVAFEIPENVATVEEGGAAKQPGARGGPDLSFRSIIIIALAAAVGIGVLLLILKFVQSKREWVSQKMEKMGVRLPGEPQDDAGAVHTTGFGKEPQPVEPLVPEGTCPFCGQVKAADGTCACTVGTAAAAPSYTAGPRLLGMTGLYAGRSFDLPDGEVTIGREAGNDVCLDQDSSVSRRHARLMRHDGGATVEDLGSTNGTFVNGRPVEGAEPISPGDTVQFGESRFRYEG